MTISEEPSAAPLSRGTAHPRIPDAVYPADYGCLAGTTSTDGEGIDVFLGSGDRAEVSAVLLTADAAKRDVVIKLLLGCAPEETAVIQRFVADVLRIGGLLVEKPRRSRLQSKMRPRSAA